MLNTLIHHCEAVLHLRFSDGIMVTCSKVNDSGLKAMFCILKRFVLNKQKLFSASISCTLCLQDRSIAVWDMQSPTDINLRRVLVGHRAAVNVVDFDQKYIVSASGDRTIKVGTTLSGLLLL